MTPSVNVVSMRPLSWSSLTTFESCPLRWRLKYVEGAPAEAPPQSRVSMGKALHSALEAYYLEDVRRGRGGDVRASRQALQSAGLPEDARREAADVLDSWTRRESRRRRAPVVAVEKPFRVTLPNGVPFQGIIDRIDAAPARGVSLTDYKTGAAPPNPWMARKSAQLGYYQIGAEAGLGMRVEHLAIEHLRTGLRFTSDPRSRAELDALVARAGRAWDDIGAGRFEARLGRDCPCEFARRCPFFSDLFPKVEDWTGEERARVAGLVEAYAATRDPEARGAIEAYLAEAGVLRAWGSTHVVERTAAGALRVRPRPVVPDYAPASPSPLIEREARRAGAT